jgi:hypothetical protein
MTRPRAGRTAPIPPTVTRVGSDPVAPKTPSGARRRQTHGPDRRRSVRGPDQSPGPQANPARQPAPITARDLNIGASDSPAQILSP